MRRVGLRNVALWLAGLVLSVAAAVLCQQIGRLTFRAQVSQLPLQNNPLARNKRPEDFVEITLPGLLRNPPLAVELIPKAQADWSTPEHAMASIRSANTAADADWILLNFVPAERSGVHEMIRDPEVFQRNTDYHRSVRKAEITGSAIYGKFIIIFLHEESEAGQARTVPVTLTRTASGWKQTNALSKDSTFDVVWTALRNGGVR